jgi:hypothetical protein
MFLQASKGIAVKIQTEKSTIIMEGDAESSSNIITLSQDKSKASSESRLTWPGEYELQGSMFKGIDVDHTSVIFTAQVEGVHIVHLGQAHNIGPDTLDQIDTIDVLILPISDAYFSPEEAKKFLANVETRIVIPVGDQVSQFLPLVGASEVIPQMKVKLSKSSLPIDKMEVIILQQ